MKPFPSLAFLGFAPWTIFPPLESFPMAASPKNSSSGPVESQDPLSGDKTVTVKNAPGQHLIDRQGQDQVVLPGANDGTDSPANGPMQISSRMTADTQVLDQGKLDQLGEFKSVAFGLFSLLERIGHSDELEQAGIKIREAVMWVHNHLTGASSPKPRYQPPGEV